MPKKTAKKNEILVTEVEAKARLRKAGIPVIETRLARTKAEAVAFSKEMGYPVAMKIVSPDAIHKSDVGGVKLGIANATQAGKAYSDIVSSVKKQVPNANIEGVSVQKMAEPGVEIIIGMNQDPQFGPVLMFGLGGILVEVLKDVSFRLVPVTRLDAAEMVREIKGNALLHGYRGQKPVNIPALEKLIVKVSDFIEKNPDIEELDLSPLIATASGIIAVDARIVLKSE
ncbi:MAG: acetate--CoA ligase family protein [Dehalococcoidales bacterium]|nr:acetate--CoA ligase family protein [Dehalococcoidales bacterium]